MKHPLIIGAGGVCSYMLPVLLKTFKPEQITIIDKDKLEARNLDRQMFDEDQIGMNKATALIEKHWDKKTPGIKVIPEWFDLGTLIPNEIDSIFCCADNHMARYAAIQRANELKCFAYIGGNEYIDSQALVYHPSFKDTDKDLLLKYPNIATDETGSPFRCTGQAQEASPQLAMANMNCAAKLLHLAWVYERWLPEQDLMPEPRKAIINQLPVEFYSSLSINESTHTFKC